MTIGEKIKEFRKKAGFTQKQLAKECGLAEITIRQYESGKREPSFDRLFLIAEKLHVSVTELIDEESFNKAAEEVAVKSLENLTIEKIKKLFTLNGYNLTQIDNDNFLLYTDYKFLDIKEITLDLGDLSEIEIWLDEFLDKSIKHLYNQKNNPSYKPRYRDLPYYLDDEILTEGKEELERIKREFEELQKRPKPQIPSYYEMQRRADMEKKKTSQDTDN